MAQCRNKTNDKVFNKHARMEDNTKCSQTTSALTQSSDRRNSIINAEELLVMFDKQHYENIATVGSVIRIHPPW